MAEIFDRASTIMAEEGVAGRSRPGWVSAGASTTRPVRA
jgi:hypothetical protein